MKTLYEKLYLLIDEKGYTISEHETRTLAAAARRAYLEGVTEQSDRDAVKIKNYYRKATNV